MQNFKDKKIAIVCDWIKDFWGAELVLEQFLELFPEASIYTSIFFPAKKEIFNWKKIYTSFIQKIPILNKSHKLALTLRPKAFEAFDLSNYDIVFSLTSAESKWVITKPETLHICYCHTPTRYFWSHYHDYINMWEFGILNPIAKFLMPRLIYKLRQWDFVASKRPDYFIANSKNTAIRINKYYKREAEVIYPWIDLSIFPLVEAKEDFYLYVWRCIPYKRFDLIVDTFNKNWKKIIIVTNTINKLQKKLEKISKDNIIWKKNISNEEKIDLYSRTKAFLFPPEEDFWLVPIEAMACGTAVIAFWKWWATETILDWKTWVFFEKQNIDSLNNAIVRFEKMIFNPKEIRKHAEKFSKENFKNEIINFIKKHKK